MIVLQILLWEIQYKSNCKYMSHSERTWPAKANTDKQHRIKTRQDKTNQTDWSWGGRHCVFTEFLLDLLHNFRNTSCFRYNFVRVFYYLHLLLPVGNLVRFVLNHFSTYWWKIMYNHMYKSFHYIIDFAFIENHPNMYCNTFPIVVYACEYTSWVFFFFTHK